MKVLILSLAALSILAAPVSAQTKVEKVQETIEATSDIQWLPKWHQYATAQMDQLDHNPNMGLQTAFFLAKMTIGNSFQNGWDEFFWCGNLTPESLANDTDIRFDYCADVNGWDKETSKDFDPEPKTNTGGLFWVGNGRN